MTKEIVILAQDTVLDPHLTIITRTDTGLTGQDHIPTVTDTEAMARVIHREVAPGHITDIHTGAHLTTDTQPFLFINGTHHTGDLHCTEALSHILEITAGQNPCTSHKTTCMEPSKPSYSSNRKTWKNKDKKYKQVTIDDPHLIITALMNHPVSKMKI